MRFLAAETPWLLAFLAAAAAAIVPPPWADPSSNPCATQPRGWQLLYWPPDGKCYKIFQIGAPCPETMELSPSAVGTEARAECRCPPGTAQSPRDALCHPIFTRASCPKGQYFAPVPEAVGKPSPKKRWGICREPEPCLSGEDIFWPKDGKCHARHTRGPCPKGELLILDKDGLGACSCSGHNELAKYRSPAGDCHEHYTKGPCQEPGELFLPNGTCGCHPNLPHYHTPTKMCYQLGGIGPCPTGHHFVISANNVTDLARASCSCKPRYLLYKDGLCYRAYTQGPCESGYMLVNSTSCVPVPCKRSRLYFPRERTCYKIGTRGPCPNGQIVLYDYSARPSIDGISYNGVCGCTSASKANGKCYEGSGSSGVATPAPGALLGDECERSPGMVLVNRTCYRLYTQGPCSPGEWLVARRMARGLELWRDKRPMSRARCECRPGYTKTSELESNSLLSPGKCQPPAVGLAKFLNERVKSLVGHPVI